MILACADGGLLCVPALVAGAGALVAWIKLRKPMSASVDCIENEPKEAK